MRSLLKKIGCLVLPVLLVLFVCSACKTGDPKEGDDPTGESDSTAVTTSGKVSSGEASSEDPAPPETPEKVSLISGGESDYCLIYPPDDASAQSVMSAFLKLVRSSTGCLLDFAEDDDLPASDAQYEILIGDTNRSESISAIAELGEREYLIRMSGKKIVLAGADSYALSLAVSEFYEQALHGNALEIPADYKKKGAYSVTEDYLIAVADQKSEELLVYDLAKGGLTEENVIWRLSTPGFCVGGFRLRELNGVGKVMLGVSTTHAIMVDYESKEIIWRYDGNLIWNAHAIELLPNGVIAVAGSTGNNLTFFDSSDPENKHPLNLEFPDAHGTMWDPEHQLLWACGKNVLKAYRVSLNDGIISAEEQRSLTIPSDGAHDLQPVYGTPGKYWITTWSDVYLFDSSAGTFEALSSSLSIGLKNVKGIGSFPDGCIVETIADGSYESWNTATVHMYRYNRILKIYVSEDFVSPTGAAFYKVRVWNSSYQ